MSRVSVMFLSFERVFEDLEKGVRFYAAKEAKRQ
jgi:hypothetical protein